jgi:FAD/FMN-containing dehydrogenase
LSNKEEVAAVLSVIKATNSKFEIRSTGHNANPGFSSDAASVAGFVLDLRGLKSKVLEKSADITHIGAGNN